MRPGSHWMRRALLGRLRQNFDVLRADVRDGLFQSLTPSIGSDVKFDIDVNIFDVDANDADTACVKSPSLTRCVPAQLGGDASPTVRPGSRKMRVAPFSRLRCRQRSSVDVNIKFCYRRQLLMWDPTGGRKKWYKLFFDVDPPS